MSIIQASFPENIFFSSQENHTELCDFVFSIHINAKLKEKKDKDQSEENLPIVYIGGLSKLFPKVEENPENKKSDSSLKNFIRDLRVIGNDNNWSIKYNDKYDLLKLKCKTEHSFTDKYTVGFELPQECEFSKELENNEPIPLDVTFINFDSIFDGLANETVASYTIYAKEVPYVEEFYACLGSEGKKVKTVPKGEWVKITWSVRNAPKASAFLCDESGTVICNKEEKPVMSPYNVQINEDRRFKLFVEKDGHRASQILTVNQISPIEVAVFNSHGEQTEIFNIEDMATIKWSGENIEKCTVSLCDEDGTVVAKQSPHQLRTKETQKFNLKLEREDCVVSKEFWIYRTEWRIRKREQNIPSIDFCDVGTKGDNRFWSSRWGNIFLCYVDKLDGTIPYILEYNPDKYGIQLSKYSVCNFPPDVDKVKCYRTCYLCNIETESEIFGICYTLHDRIEIRDYIISSKGWRWESERWRRESIDLRELIVDTHLDGDFLFCQECDFFGNLRLIAVYQHVVRIFPRDLQLRRHYHSEIIVLKNNANIISIDFCIDSHGDMLAAILCDNNYVYLYHVDYDLRYDRGGSCLRSSYNLDEINNPQRVYLFTSNKFNNFDFIVIIVDGHFIFNNKFHLKKFHEELFSPKDTIIDKQNGFMYIGIKKRDERLHAIVRDNNMDTVWEFDLNHYYLSQLP